MKAYILYDKYQQPYVRGIFTRKKLAIEERDRLENNSNKSEFSNPNWKRFCVTEVEVNRVYY